MASTTTPTQPRRMTQLIVAAGNGLLDEVKRLVEKDGYDVDESGGPLCHTPLYVAAAKGHLDVVWLLLNVGAAVNSQSTGNKQTALMEASFFGHVDVVKVLLSWGADICLSDGAGETALHKTAKYQTEKHLAVAKMLIARGANVYDVDQDGNRPSEITDGDGCVTEFLRWCECVGNVTVAALALKNSTPKRPSYNNKDRSDMYSVEVTATTSTEYEDDGDELSSGQEGEGKMSEKETLICNWFMARITGMDKLDAAHYATNLIAKGFDCEGILNEVLISDDVKELNMKVAHERFLLQSLKKEGHVNFQALQHEL